MNPESSHAPINHIGDGRPRAMLAETMKMPDPIIEPATSIVASVSDIAFTNPESDCGGASVEAAERLMQDTEKARVAPEARARAVQRGIRQN